MENSEIRIVLLGKGGSGKSSTGNTILGKQLFKVASSSQPVTKESRRRHKELEDTIVTVIDTPGLFGIETKANLKVQIEEAVDLAYPGVHVFLLVIRLGVRFSEDEQNTVEWFQKILGEEAQKHIIVLFTHGNELGETTIEEHLQGDSALKKLVASMVDYHVFENDNGDDKTQLTELLKKIDKLMDKNGKKMYTEEMYSKVQKKKQQRKYMEYVGISGALGTVVLGVAAAARGGHPGIAGAAAGAAALAMGVATWAWGRTNN